MEFCGRLWQYRGMAFVQDKEQNSKAKFYSKEIREEISCLLNGLAKPLVKFLEL